jgi:hypothetical protein
MGKIGITNRIDMNEFDSSTKSGLLHSSGSPLPPRVTWKQRWDTISRMIKILLVMALAVVAAAAALLTNLQTIQKYFAQPPVSPKVPPIVIDITNSSNNTVEVVTRGDFFLWLPGPGAQHMIGKYELYTLKNVPMESLVLTVKPAGKLRLLAHVLNQDLYGRVLTSADCDIAFMVRKASGGFKTTDNLPFTKEAINKYCTTVDIGAD